MYASYIPLLILSWMLAGQLKQVGQGSSEQAFKILFGYGSLVQVSSVLALLTYRLTYYYTEAWLGLAALGLLSVAAQISEAVWILPKSIALVQFSKISNLKNDSDSAHLTFFLGTITSVFTLLALSVLVFLPDQVYTYIFGNDFTGISPVVRIFAPGIFAMSLNIILSHYFSGTGRILFNLAGSAIGLITVAISGFIFIRNGNLSDAAMVSTLGYAINFLFAWLCFLWITRRERISIRKGFLFFRDMKAH
jgi:O-antigen/teichoic acid export membrane protein